MEMKKSIFVMMVSLFAGCSDNQLTGNAVDVRKDAEPVSEVSDARIRSLVDRARWGDGQAYLQLADCFRDGIGVKKDFLGMVCMVGQARDHDAIRNEDVYFSRLPDDNEYKRLFDLLNIPLYRQREQKDSILAQLSTMECPDALAFRGVKFVEGGDSVGGFETIRKAAENGSNFAALLLTSPDMKRFDKNKLEQIADKVPFVYTIVGGMCLDPEENGPVDEKQAACYFLKAEKHAMLTKWKALWLLRYYRNGGEVQLSDEDVKRLESLVRAWDEDDDDEVVVTDTVCTDSI